MLNPFAVGHPPPNVDALQLLEFQNPLAALLGCLGDDLAGSIPFAAQIDDIEAAFLLIQFLYRDI